MEFEPNSEDSLELGRSVSSRDHSGNIALCRTSSGSIECLGNPAGFNNSSDTISSRTETGSNENNSDEPLLNWRYEKGLLRSVGLDGIATNMCLGPMNRVMDGSTGTPYELALQECPHIPGPNENIFRHSISTTTTSSSIDAATAPLNGTPKATRTNARHLQFLMTRDGRVQSLAPVLEDPTNHPTAEDMVEEKPFCLTVMKWEDDKNEKAYLAPCYRESNRNSQNQYQVFENRETHDLMTQIEPDQQIFDVERVSSYDSFLMNLHSKDENIVQLAYQIGFSGEGSSSRLNDRNNYDDFESIVIRIIRDMEDASSSSSSSSFSSPTLVSEKEVSSVWSNNESNSGVVSFQLSSFSASGTMEAHLMGRSMGGLETTWLASTSFEVSDRVIADSFPNGWTWSLLVFSGIMFCYLAVIKANSFFCPRYGIRHRRKEPRISEVTAATMNTINNHGIDLDVSDWGFVPTIDVQLPNRISEEDEGNEGDDTDGNSQSVYGSSFESVYDRNSTLHTETTVDIDSTLDTRTSSDLESLEQHRRR